MFESKNRPFLPLTPISDLEAVAGRAGAQEGSNKGIEINK